LDRQSISRKDVRADTPKTVLPPTLPASRPGPLNIIVNHHRSRLRSRSCISSSRYSKHSCRCEHSVASQYNHSNMRQVGSALWPRLRAVQVYGANTGVGKTVVSTLLCKALRKRLPDYNVHYLKPISTGPLDDQDNRYAHLNNQVQDRLLSSFEAI
jgi:Cdc6-like AAA superfamily ATPase